MPNLIALSAACWAANWPANGVLLRLPLKPVVPALDQQSVSPLVSVMVTVVLLNVALMWATPTVTLRRVRRRFDLATVRSTPSTVRSLRFAYEKTRAEQGLPHVFYSLLAGHGFLGAFAGAGIGASTLAPHGQTAPMPQPPVTSYV